MHRALPSYPKLRRILWEKTDEVFLTHQRDAHGDALITGGVRMGRKGVGRLARGKGAGRKGCFHQMLGLRPRESGEVRKGCLNRVPCEALREKRQGTDEKKFGDSAI